MVYVFSRRTIFRPKNTGVVQNTCTSGEVRVQNYVNKSRIELSDR